MPFGMAQVVQGSWSFGKTWCQEWVMLDLTLCQASVFNMLSINIDRFYAVYLPIQWVAWLKCQSNFQFIVTTPKAENMSSQWLFFHGCWPPSLSVQCLAHIWQLRKHGMSAQLMGHASHQRAVMIFLGSSIWQLLDSSCPSQHCLYFKFLFWSSARVVSMPTTAVFRRRWNQT